MLMFNGLQLLFDVVRRHMSYERNFTIAYSRKIASEMEGFDGQFTVQHALTELLIPLSVYHPEAYKWLLDYQRKKSESQSALTPAKFEQKHEKTT